MSEMDTTPGDNPDEILSSLDLAPTEAELRRCIEPYPVPSLPTETGQAPKVDEARNIH